MNRDAIMAYKKHSFLLFFILLFPPFQAFSQPPFKDMEIKELRFGGAAKDIPEADLRYLLTIREGDLYSFSQIKKSIKNLYLKGTFSQVFADAIRKDDGLILTFMLTLKPMAVSVKIKGNKALDDNELLPHIPLKRGADLTDEVIKKSEDKIKEIYRNNGYYRAHIKTKISGKENEAKVIFMVREHRVCLLENVNFKGELIFSKEQLYALFKSEISEPLKVAFLEEDRKRLFDFYKRAGYLHVRISEPAIIFNNNKKGKATITFDINGGPLTSFRIKDNRFFSKDEIIKIINPDLGDTINEDRLNKWEEKILFAYRDNGFTAANVSAELTLSEKEKKVSFIIDEGLRYHIGAITIRGNRLIEKNRISGLIKPATALLSPAFSMNRLDKQIEELKERYRKRGVLTVQVKKNLIFNRDKGTTDIELVIKEGPQSIIKKISFGGNQVIREDQLRRKTAFREGDTINMEKIDNAAREISRFYSEQGYIYAEIERDFGFSEDKSEAKIHFQIDEGPLARMGKIIIRGNRQTKSRIIMRELSLSEGHIYDPEKVGQDRLNVYKTGLFKRVRYEERKSFFKDKTKDMLLTVDERKAGAIEIGMGYATDVGLRAFAGISYLNIGGTGRSARLRGSISRIRNNIILGYKEPWLAGFSLDGRLDLVRQHQEKESYDIEKDGIVLGIDKRLSREIKFSLQYKIEKSKYSNVEAGTAQEEGRSTIGTIGPIIVRDSRDDPFNPEKGSVNLLQFEMAGKALASDDEFHKTTARSSWYRRLTDPFIAALSLRAGYIDLLGDTLNVPADKRFYLGGRTTVRGYKEDSIGPENAFGSPIGGEAMININMEARIRLINDLGGLLFWDAGNVWQTSDKRKLSHMRKSYGGGIRYLTPIGPLSLEYGHKIDRPSGESKGEWYFTIGNIF
ncbi:MAG: outer membrane protein assembly factor BamA [Deltaproteobacteria bacterium]|nr:outer membrane protein assembly factor BamA [Deltaproteobacteria bacterium]